MFTWMREHETILWWLFALSVLSFIGTLIALPLVIARLPADYFRRDHRHARRRQEQPIVLRLSGILLKNLLGLVLILAGVAMLLLPGQGVLTILIGLMLMDFPGKRKLERRIIQQPAIFRAINWMRFKAHQPPLELPDAETLTAPQRNN
jgi:hypothetical protein